MIHRTALIRPAGLFFSLLLSLISAHAAELGDPSQQFEGVAAASDEGQRAIKSFTVPQGLEIELIAAEPLLANAVAFSIDEQGRFYVVETFRHGAGVLDIRGRRGWPKAAYREDLPESRIENLANETLDVDLAVRSVDDRIAYLKNYFGKDISQLTGTADRVRVLWDSDNDGKPDQSAVFMEGNAQPEDGLGSGVLAWRGEVWYTDIPYLWHATDRDHDGVAENRRALLHGFGSRTGFLGHDLHGLEFGPDGKLYFTVGDRAASVMLGGSRVMDVPDSGAVFRCNPDGSELEAFAVGLRNPQELTFDQHGNLFTGDNNSDGGDEARWVQLLEGGDSGWRIGYQFLEGSDSVYYNTARGPWNAEKMWHPQNLEQPTFLVPPIANIGNGPSGVAFYPGTGLAEMWNGQFFLVDFKGQANVSGVHTFDLMPKGAGFEIGYKEHFVWNMLATDIEFGVDGGVYLIDWVSGWNKTGKGRIYRVFDPGLEGDKRIAETKKLLAEPMTNHSNRELGRLLGNQDYRIRLDAQFELVRRGEDGLRELISASRQTKLHLARLHGAWGVGQILNQFRGQIAGFETREDCIKALMRLLDDENEILRGQAAKLLGDARAAESFDALIKLTRDENSLVRYHAVMSLGKLNRLEAVPAILEVVRQNNDQDPILRHAGVYALAQLNDLPTLKAAANDASPAVRMTSLLAMRRLKRDDIEMFLGDEDYRIVQEAARAINDVPIRGARQKLAALELKNPADFVVAGRIVNANLRNGNTTNARRLVDLGADQTLPEPVRQDALLALAEWAAPSGRDRVTGVWNPVIATTRDAVMPATVFKPKVASILIDSPDKVQLAAIQAVTRLKIREAGPQLFQLIANSDAATPVRVAALKALAGLQDPQITEAVRIAAASDKEPLRNAADAVSAQIGGDAAIGSILKTLASGSVTAKQQAVASLASIKSPAAISAIDQLLTDLESGKLDKAIAIDVLEAAAVSEELQKRADAILAADPGELGPYRFSYFGGDPERGYKIFHEREDVACLRCHKAGGVGGEVGPVLDGLASRVSEQHILEAIVMPNKDIAEGFENVMIETKDGTWYAGMIKSDTADQLVINSPEDGIITLEKSQVKTRERGASGMPEGMALILSKRDLRDLVAYLKSLK